MLQIKVSDRIFELEDSSINGTTFNWDLLDLKDNSFHIIKNHVSYRAMLLERSEDGKQLTLSINGKVIVVDIKDKFDILLEQLGMNQMTSTKVSNIKAPMPGLVLDINVKVGDTVSKGDAVMILEAMKMENMLKSSGDGVVKSINIKQGEAVEKNQVLIEFE